MYPPRTPQPTGVASDEGFVDLSGDGRGRLHFSVERSIMRPEVLESIWYMWRLTGNPKYRRWGWRIFTAYERHARVQHGYGGVEFSRDKHNAVIHDAMESFWLAETLKYLYLLFADDSVWPLNEWVFNTEAHPLRAKPGCSLTTYHRHAAETQKRSGKP